MSTIGGLNSNSLLPYIDYDAFQNNPKIMIGYSDATALLLGIYAKQNSYILRSGTRSLFWRI